MLQFSLQSIPENGLPLSAEVELGPIQPEGVEDLPCQSVTFDATAEIMGNDIFVQGQVAGVFTHTCDRCLEEGDFPFNLDIAWLFEPLGSLQEAGVDMEENDEGTHLDTGVARCIVDDAVDLRPHVWEEVALAMPTKFICDENCLGLCGQCGKNLNSGVCNCDPATEQDEPVGNRGLAGLAEMFPDLAPKNVKDDNDASTETTHG